METAVKSILSTPAHVDAVVREVLGRASFRAGSLSVPLADAHGRILAQDVRADREQPPFNRAAMDGIAVRGAALESGTRTFRRVGELAAGADPRSIPPDDTAADDSCIEIMTGAAVPAQFDTVIRYEDLVWSADRDGTARCEVTASGLAVGENIHPRGGDYARGDLLAEPGTRIGSGLVSVLASCGYANVAVRALPRIGIIGTGDELVPVTDRPLDHQIRASNPPTIAAELEAWGLAVHHVSIVGDDRDNLEAAVRTALEKSEIVLLSGAVSKGKYDSVPEILSSLGVEIVIHGVRQRPGKPLLVGEANGRLVLGLPGNPVSSLVSVRRYLVPALVAPQDVGRADARVRDATGYPVRLSRRLEFRKKLTWYPTMRASVDAEGIVAEVVEGNGSGDFSQLAGSSGIAVVDEAIDELEAGRTVWFYPWG